jgi:hypothetical protein
MDDWLKSLVLPSSPDELEILLFGHYVQPRLSISQDWKQLKTETNEQEKLVLLRKILNAYKEVDFVSPDVVKQHLHIKTLSPPCYTLMADLIKEVITDVYRTSKGNIMDTYFSNLEQRFKFQTKPMSVTQFFKKMRILFLERECKEQLLPDVQVVLSEKATSQLQEILFNCLLTSWNENHGLDLRVNEQTLVSVVNSMSGNLIIQTMTRRVQWFEEFSTISPEIAEQLYAYFIRGYATTFYNSRKFSYVTQQRKPSSIEPLLEILLKHIPKVMFQGEIPLAAKTSVCTKSIQKWVTFIQTNYGDQKRRKYRKDVIDAVKHYKSDLLSSKIQRAWLFYEMCEKIAPSYRELIQALAIDTLLALPLSLLLTTAPQIPETLLSSAKRPLSETSEVPKRQKT